MQFNTVIRNAKKVIIGFFICSFMHSANAAFIDFVPSKQSVVVGETFSVSLMLRDINQDPTALDFLSAADYNISFREDLLDYVDQMSMIGIGLQGFSYLSQQNPQGFGNLTLISSQLTATSSDQIYIDSQITNNINDFFTIDEITFVATSVGIASFASNSIFFSGNNLELEQETTQFDVTITQALVNVSAPANGLLLSLLMAVLVCSRAMLGK